VKGRTPAALVIISLQQRAVKATDRRPEII
jgi:hypothetical protein